jgi:hypothetical protein
MGFVVNTGGGGALVVVAAAVGTVLGGVAGVTGRATFPLVLVAGVGTGSDVASRRLGSEVEHVSAHSDVAGPSVSPAHPLTNATPTSAKAPSRANFMAWSVQTRRQFQIPFFR